MPLCLTDKLSSGAEEFAWFSLGQALEHQRLREVRRRQLSDGARGQGPREGRVPPFAPLRDRQVVEAWIVV